MTESDDAPVKSDFGPVLDAGDGALLRIQTNKANATVDESSTRIVMGNEERHCGLGLKKAATNPSSVLHTIDKSNLLLTTRKPSEPVAQRNRDDANSGSYTL